jgi:Zn-dependent protease with chaperone function
VRRTRLLRCSAALLLAVGALLTAALALAAIDAAFFHPLSHVADGVLVVVGGGIGVAAAVAASGSTVRQLRAHRRVARRLAPLQVGPGIVRDPEPRAFCVGLVRPRVVVTTGALTTLSDGELAALLAHEAAHVRRRDGLRLLLVRAAADGLFFCPGARQLAARLAALAELEADEAADRHGLAAAMLRIDGVCPERVDRLLGAPVRWSIDAGALAWGAVVVAALAVVAIALASATGCAHHPFASGPTALEDAPLGALLVGAGAATLLLSRRTLAGRLDAP